MKSRQKKSHKRSHQTHHRKADISINTIIIAALGLLVLVVLIAVFTGRFGAFNVAVGQQQSDFAKCSSACAARDASAQALIELSSSCSSGQIEIPGYFAYGKDTAGKDIPGRCCCVPKPSQ